MQDYSQNLFEDVKGQRFAVTVLESALKKKCIANAYLFSGPEGVGRKKTALKFIEGIINESNNKLNAKRRLKEFNLPDLLWVEPTYLIQGNMIPKSKAEEENVSKRIPPQIRLEQIKKIKDFLSKNPLEIKKGIVVIEEVEKINESGANALLKTLEEPNKGIFILITNRKEHLLKTIVSRCQLVPFLRLNESLIKEILTKGSNNEETINALSENEKELISLANGSPGELMKNIRFWNEIPKNIFEDLKSMPKDSLKNLSLAKQISEELDLEQQIWMIYWLQNFIWVQSYNSRNIRRLEKLKSQLFSFVQPRLAWEIALLEINFIN